MGTDEYNAQGPPSLTPTRLKKPRSELRPGFRKWMRPGNFAATKRTKLRSKPATRYVNPNFNGGIHEPYFRLGCNGQFKRLAGGKGTLEEDPGRFGGLSHCHRANTLKRLKRVVANCLTRTRLEEPNRWFEYPKIDSSEHTEVSVDALRTSKHIDSGKAAATGAGIK